MQPKLSTFRSGTDYSLYYDIDGNSSIHDAEIVVIPDIPPIVTHISHDNKVSLINEIYRGHLVLVENTAFGLKIKTNENPLTKGVNRNIVVQGWDLPGLSYEIEKNEINIKNLTGFIKTYLKDFNCKLILSDENFEIFLKYFTTEEIKNNINGLIDDLKNDPIPVLAQRIDALIHAAKWELKQKMMRLHKEKFPVRIKNLVCAIELGLRRFEKIIVCANGSFVIRNPLLQGKEYDIEELTNFLKTKKYVIINPKISPLRLPCNQTSLWRSEEEKEKMGAIRRNSMFF